MMRSPKRVWSLDEMMKIRIKPLLSTQDMLVQWSIIGQFKEPARHINKKENREEFTKTLRELITELSVPELDMCKIAADRLLSNIENEISTAQILHDVNDLRGRLIDQIDNIYLVSLSKAERDIFDPAEPLFGPEVTSKFPTALFDIDEGAKCLATGRYTACCFHLMRVMEIGVQKLGKKLKVKIDPRRETWHQILLHANKSIDSLPAKSASQKARKAKMATCSAHLNNVRIAWRNEVMHPKATYTEEEAKDIFGHVKTFMRDLSALI